MSFKMQRVHVFHAEVEDKPGGISGEAEEAGRGRGAPGVRVQPAVRDQARMGDLYVAPLHGNGEMAAARAAGMHEVREPIVMRVEGDDKAGLGGRLTQAWEMAGINLHGLVMSVIGGKFVGYATFDSVADANRAATILAELGTA